jgi:hypothetical protein
LISREISTDERALSKSLFRTMLERSGVEKFTGFIIFDYSSALW